MPDTPEPARHPRRILAKEYAQALADAGLIANISDVHRILLDVHAERPLTVWVEYYADERWLDILPGEGVTIRDQPVDLSAERLAMVRQYLVAEGYFTEEQIGEDLAPRVAERIGALRTELAKTQEMLEKPLGRVITYRVDGRDVPPERVQVIREPPVEQTGGTER